MNHMENEQMHAQTHAHAKEREREREYWDAIHLVTSINRQSRNSFDYGIILPTCVRVSTYSPHPQIVERNMIIHHKIWGAYGKFQILELILRKFIHYIWKAQTPTLK
ncbi:hypothetical protein ACB094_04G026400 [Castanea mollissima]